eukprot:2994009-Rhodomonas_salina.2
MSGTYLVYGGVTSCTAVYHPTHPLRDVGTDLAYAATRLGRPDAAKASIDLQRMAVQMSVEEGEGEGEEEEESREGKEEERERGKVVATYQVVDGTDVEHGARGGCSVGGTDQGYGARGGRFGGDVT